MQVSAKILAPMVSVGYIHICIYKPSSEEPFSLDLLLINYWKNTKRRKEEKSAKFCTR